MNSKISVHHIGGRAGSRAFPILRSFEKDIINVLYDADKDCIEGIKEANRNHESELYVFPYCFSSEVSSSKLNINYDPYTSSLYKFNPYYNGHYFFNMDHDYIFGEVCKPMVERSVDLVTIDHMFRDMPDFPKPDFLSLDTQGSEWDILNGARETLKNSVLAVALEVEFHSIYQGQKLFGDISGLLSSLGFQFVKFDYLGISSPYRAPVGLRGEGFQTYGEAFFLKRIENIESENKIDNFLMFQKMAFIAIVNNQFEYGLKCLERSKDINRQYSIFEQLKNVPEYCKFLSELEKQIMKMPQHFPPTFAEKYTFETSKARFDTVEKQRSYAYSIKLCIKKIPGLIKVVRPGLIKVDRMAKRLIHFKYIKRYSNVEKVWVRYNLIAQAKILMKNRIIQSRCIKSF